MSLTQGQETALIGAISRLKAAVTSLSGTYVPYTGATANVNLGTFTITSPSLYGSSASGGTLTIDSTSHATKGAMTFGTASSSNVYNFNVGTAATAIVSFQGLVGTTTLPAIYLGQSSPSATNYFVLTTSTGPQINSVDRIGFNVLDVQVARLDGTRAYFIKPTNIGSTGTPLRMLSIVQDTATINMGSVASSTSNCGFYFNIGTPSNVNYGILGNATTTQMNAVTTVQLCIGGTTKFNMASTGVTMLSTSFSTVQGADVASANNLVLGTDGNIFEITGATQINLISNVSFQNGTQVTLLFTSNPVVKHNQATATTNITIQLAGAVDFSATSGDTLTLVLSEIGGTQAWREVSRAVI